MKCGPSKSIFVLLAVLGLAAYGCASGAAGNAVRGSGPASDVASLLNGTYRLQEGNSDLRLDISSTSGVGSRYELLATASGTYEGRSVSEQSRLQIETEGPDVLMNIIPRFGEPVTQLSPDVSDLSQREIQGACTLYLRPYDEGWAGAAPGTGSCVQAITGATGQWQMQIEPGVIRFSDPRSNRTLVFREIQESRGR
jgi:hypothetical protein